MGKKAANIAENLNDVTTTPSEDVETLLVASYQKFSPLEKTVADFFLSNLSQLPFETGTSIAAKAGVSPMTVVRFIRSLGYHNLKHLKSELRLKHNEEQLDDVLERFKVRPERSVAMRKSLTLEIQAIIAAYDLTTTERWLAIVNILHSSAEIFAVGFQASMGLALDFVSRMKAVRSGVRFAEIVDGTYSEVLDCNPSTSCLVIIDTIAYHRKALLLAKKARELKIPLVIVTDRFSHWAKQYTDNVLSVHTSTGTFWDSPASLAVILNLLIDAVASKLGTAAEERKDFMHTLTRDFGDNEPY